MREEERNGKKEQLTTVTNAFIKNDMDLKDVGAALTLYGSLNRAKQRAGKRKGYEKIEFLLKSAPAKALIQLIKHEPNFWSDWKKQQVIFEDSKFNEYLRPSLNRVNPKKHYELGNLSMIPYGEHLQENAVITGFFGTKDGKSYFEYFHSITAASKFFGVPANMLNGIENQGVNINGYVGMYSRIEQGEPRGKEENEAADKESYMRLLKKIDIYEARHDLDERDASMLDALHKTKDINEFLGFHLL